MQGAPMPSSWPWHCIAANGNVSGGGNFLHYNSPLIGAVTIAGTCSPSSPTLQCGVPFLPGAARCCASPPLPPEPGGPGGWPPTASSEVGLGQPCHLPGCLGPCCQPTLDLDMLRDYFVAVSAEVCPPLPGRSLGMGKPSPSFPLSLTLTVLVSQGQAALPLPDMHPLP